MNAKFDSKDIAQTIPCQICGSKTLVFCQLKVQGSIPARFLQCEDCRHIFAKDPDWLDGSFSTQLNQLDIGALDRCLIVADFVEVIVRAQRESDSRILDWGGGYGILTRLLRDRGLNAWHFDPFAQPLFAEPAVGVDGTFQMIILSEVALHFRNPVEEFSKIFEQTDSILFTAVVTPANADCKWWYLMPDSGQHICLFSRDSLQALAERLGAQITSDGRFFHLLHRRPINIRSRVFFRFRGLAFLRSTLYTFERLFRRATGRNHSKLFEDQTELINRLPWNRTQDQ